MNALPSVDESFDRLHRAGWSVGEVATTGEWVVIGTNGRNVVVNSGHCHGSTHSGVVPFSPPVRCGGRCDRSKLAELRYVRRCGGRMALA